MRSKQKQFKQHWLIITQLLHIFLQNQVHQKIAVFITSRNNLKGQKNCKRSLRDQKLKLTESELSSVEIIVRMIK